MLNVSKLWTAVDLGSLDPLLVASSRSQPLSVSMEFSKISDDRYQRSFEALRPEAWRWKSLTVVGYSLEESIDSRNGTTQTRLKQLRDTFQGVTFPALESLNVDYDRDYPVDEEGIVLSGQNDPNTTIRNFFNPWNMPALRNLTAIGFVPTLPSSCQSTLTSLQLTLHGGEHMFDLSAVINALRPLSSLQRLSFDIMMEDWMVDEIQAATLPGLKSLSIESVATQGEQIGMLLDLIGTPNLRELDIKAEVYSCAEGVTYLDTFFPSDVPRWAELESISCFLEVVDERNSHLTGNPPFEVLCTRLPRLRHLTLGTGTTAQPSDLLLHEHFRLPSSNRRVMLTTLRVVDCPFFDTSFIISLGSIINARQFESLEIHRCPKISIEAMRTLLPSSKQFIWSPYNWSTLCYYSPLFPWLTFHPRSRSKAFHAYQVCDPLPIRYGVATTKE